MIQEIVFTSQGVVEIRAAEDVEPQRGEVKVRTVLCGISHGTEANLLRGTAPGFHRRWDRGDRVFEEGGPLKVYPVEPGYECVARVEALGEGVTGVPVGRLIWVDRPHKSAHVIPAPEAREGLLPESITPERGIFAALARVALGAIHDAAIKVGDRVAVVGLGTIGLLAVQMARLSGACEVYAFDPVPKRREMARSYGAIPVNAAPANAHKTIRDVAGRRGVDVAIETSGQYRGLQLAIGCCNVAGSVVVVSSYQGAGHELRLGEEFHRNRINLISSMTVNDAPHRSHPHWNLARMNATARRLLAEGSLNVEPMITHVFPLEEAACAYHLILERPDECIRIALRPGPA